MGADDIRRYIMTFTAILVAAGAVFFAYEMITVK